MCYGGDEKHIQHSTFFEHVLAQSDYDLSKFIFTGLVPVRALVDLLSVSDLHLYWTVPFVLELVADGRPVVRLHGPGVGHGARA